MGGGAVLLQTAVAGSNSLNCAWRTVLHCILYGTVCAAVLYYVALDNFDVQPQCSRGIHAVWQGADEGGEGRARSDGELGRMDRRKQMGTKEGGASPDKDRAEGAEEA